MWHGGWCWDEVAGILRARGHTVTTPTQTGLGERSHLIAKSITLEIFIEDLVNHLKWETPGNAVLVPHSFGGVPVCGVADRVPELIERLIFLDAALLLDGESWFGLLPSDMAEERVAKAHESSGGISFPPPPPQAFGVIDPNQVAMMEAKLTPHPLATCVTPLLLTEELGNGLPGDFIACTEPVYPPAAAMQKRASNLGWPVSELATGHDAMLTAPLETADLLEKLATGG